MAIFIIVNSLNRDLDKYLVSIMTDTETLAMYANASKQLPFDILMSSFGTVLVPHIIRFFSNKNTKEATRLCKLYLEIIYVSTGILCFAALSAAPQLMKLLYSNKYTSGLAIFCIYILVDLLRFTNLTIILSSAGKSRWLMILGLGALGTNAVLNVAFYHLMGLIGPAIATLLVTAVSGVIMLFLDVKVLKARLCDLFDFKYLLLFLAESVVLSGALAFVARKLSEWDVHYFVILILIAGTYCLTMLLLNFKRLINDMKNMNRVSRG
jgi:O-antigen/teichoic acid export membrane protein